MIENQESLREQVMISQFEMATGCTRDQSRQVLQAARWEFETALSIFFQEAHVPSAASLHQHHWHPNGHLAPGIAPCNTPATPPSFPEALLALQKLQTSSSGNNDTHHSTMFQTPKIFASLQPPPDNSSVSCYRFPHSCEAPGTQITPDSNSLSENNTAMAMSPPNSSMFPIEAQQ